MACGTEWKPWQKICKQWFDKGKMQKYLWNYLNWMVSSEKERIRLFLVLLLLEKTESFCVVF